MKIFAYELDTGRAVLSPQDSETILIIAPTAEDARKAVTEFERMELLKLADNFSYPLEEDKLEATEE